MRYLILLLALFVLTVSPASAHRPGWGDADGLTEITNIVTSFAFYRDLSQAGQVDVYTFTAKAGDRLHAGLNIPAVRGLENYGVSVALFGPGLPPADPELLPPDHPEDLGALVFPTLNSADFFEPFTQTNYWGRQRLELDLPETGEYFLIVWHPTGATGKYVLDIGTAEVFGPGDVFQFPIWWVRVHAFFGHTPYLVAAALVPLVAVTILVFRRHAHFGLAQPLEVTS